MCVAHKNLWQRARRHKQSHLVYLSSCKLTTVIVWRHQLLHNVHQTPERILLGQEQQQNRNYSVQALWVKKTVCQQVCRVVWRQNNYPVATGKKKMTIHYHKKTDLIQIVDWEVTAEVIWHQTKYRQNYVQKVGRDSSVGIAIRYRLDGPGIKSQ